MKLTASQSILTSLFAGLLASQIDETAAFVSPFSAQVRASSALARNMKPLATEGDWTAFLDEDGTGLVYYFNGKTGESLWEPPTATFPPIVLKGSMRRRARRKQEEYLKAASTSEPDQKPKGFFSTLLEDDDENDQVSTTDESEEAEPNWFSGLFEERVAKQQQEAIEQQEEVVEIPKIEAPQWLGKLFAPRPDEEAMVEQPNGEATNGASFVAPIFQQQQQAVVEEEEEEEYVQPAPVELQMSSYVLPHPMKVSWGGEDAVFTRGRTFGVFDGVSGAEKARGVPLYSKTMAKLMQESLDELDADSVDVRSITKIMNDAAKTADEASTGATTAIVGSISEDGFLRCLNVGDSTCIVIRDGKVVGKTREISHYFECPYQLSADSPDRPRDGTKFNLELLPGDLILTASDGVFDNLTPDRVAEIVVGNNVPSNKQQLSGAAKRVVDTARKVSVDEMADTPYAKQAQRFGDPDYSDGMGGKLDDVSCVLVKYG